MAIEIADRPLVSTYRFGTETADFWICSHCGVAPFVLSEIDENRFAVVNVNTFDDTNGHSFSESRSNFDGEDTESRLERRKRNWIPNVVFGITAA